jgi:hypothetical protein
MSNEAIDERRYFTSYTGVKLPFKLVNPLSDQEVENRNTYFLGHFDPQERLTGFDKLVYGEIELAHRYLYHANGTLQQAEITDIDGEIAILHYAEDGTPIVP